MNCQDGWFTLSAMKNEPKWISFNSCTMSWNYGIRNKHIVTSSKKDSCISRVPQPWHYWHFSSSNSLLWGCPTHCRIFSSILSLHLLNSYHLHSPPTSCENYKCLQMLPRGRMGWNCLQLWTSVLKERTTIQNTFSNTRW